MANIRSGVTQTRPSSDKGKAADFPDGINEADYARHPRWSVTLWAWQFLRRNPKFQRACLEVERAPDRDGARRAGIAKEFGLQAFQDYRAKMRPRFAASTVVTWEKAKGLPRSSWQGIPRTLQPGQMLVLFDLNAMRANPRSMSAQLDDAKGAFAMALWWMSIASNSDVEVKASKIKTEPLLSALRLWDAKVAGHTASAIARAVFPEKVDDMSRLNQRDLFKTRFKFAKRLVDGGYRDLATSGAGTGGSRTL